MSIKNSEFRQFAQSAQAGRGGISVLWIIVPLLILIPAGGFYAWRTGMIRGVPTSPGVPEAAAARPATVAQEAKVATPSPAGPPAAIQAAPAQAAQPVIALQTTPVPANIDARAANEALTRGIDLATRNGGFSLALSAVNYDETIAGAKGSSGRIKKVISPNDLFAYCMQQSEGVVAARVPDRRKMNGGIAMMMVSEVLLCGLRRGGKQLCQPIHKENLGKQMTFYLDLREGALTALAGDKQAQTLAKQALTLGAHREIREEMKKLASQGILSPRDFGLFTPSFVSETIGEFKNVKSSCTG